MAVAGGAALVAAAAALAEKPKIARTPARNAQARALVLRRADLGKGWSGGFNKPNFSSGLKCSYHPKQSDLVVVGAAETTWDRPTTYEIDSDHVPMLSHPDKVLAVVRDAASAVQQSKARARDVARPQATA